jgi:hypothetical protein
MKFRQACLLVLAGSIVAGSALAQDGACDRACLRDMLERYLNAVANDAPSAAPLMVGFRETDNAVVTRPGTGVWKSVTSLGGVQRYFLDPVSGQAAFLGIVNEGNAPAVAAVRIRIVDGLIGEAEWYIGREGAPGMLGAPTIDGVARPNPFNAQYLIDNPPPPERNVAQRDRLSRASLLGIANSYFDALTGHDGSLMLAHPDCYRVENGQLTTGRPLPEGSTDGYQGRTNCSSNLQIDGPFQIALVGARRFPVVDEVQQVVLVLGIFRRFPNALQRRLAFSEFFYIDDELIATVQAAMFYPEPTLPLPNWPPYDGNFPLPDSFGRTR